MTKTKDKTTCGVPNCTRYGCVLRAFAEECEETVKQYDTDAVYEIAKAYQDSFPDYEGLYEDCISLFFSDCAEFYRDYATNRSN